MVEGFPFDVVRLNYPISHNEPRRCRLIGRARSKTTQANDQRAEKILIHGRDSL